MLFEKVELAKLVEFAAGAFCYIVDCFENVRGKGRFIPRIGKGKTYGDIRLTRRCLQEAAG